LGGLLVGISRADTFELNDGQALTGDVVSFNESGLVIRLPDGKYADRVAWTKFSQADLKKLGQIPKVAPLVEPFIEVSPLERVKKTDMEVRTPPRLERPQIHSLFGAMLSSSVGLFVLVLVYAANIYAAYEVSVFRAQPRVLVCGLAAIPLLGILSPILFLSLPTRPERGQEEEIAPEVAAAAAQTFIVPGTPAPAAAAAASAQGSLRLAHAEGGRSTSSLPVTQVFQRGAYTFNRRFFETKFPGFFGILRRDPEKDMVLVVKSARGEFVGQRITRIAANDLHLHVQKGPASEEVTIPFTEIQEIQLKHKDA
jgi:hypothetical protein